MGETARAAGLAEEVIVLAENEQPVSAADAQAVEDLIVQIDWR